MKGFFRFLFFTAILGTVAYFAKQVLSNTNSPSGSGSGVLPVQPIKSLDEAPLGGEVSADLLKILVCPEDKGPLQLVESGKYLFNPRNGYKYPIRSGIPVMLIEEGKKHRDVNVVAKNGAAV